LMSARNTQTIPNKIIGNEMSSSRLFVLLLDIWLWIPTYLIRT